MAKTKSSGIQVYRAPPAAAPVIRIQSPQAIAPKKQRRRRSSGGGGGGGGGTARLLGVAVGAGIVGMLKKSGILDNIPSIPVVGRIGTVAIAAHVWSNHGGGQLARDVAMAAASVAAFQLGSQGSIDGDDDMPTS